MWYILSNPIDSLMDAKEKAIVCGYADLAGKDSERHRGVEMEGGIKGVRLPP